MLAQNEFSAALGELSKTALGHLQLDVSFLSCATSCPESDPVIPLGHPSVAKYPCAAALAGNAFHRWALEPIESCLSLLFQDNVKPLA